MVKVITPKSIFEMSEDAQIAKIEADYEQAINDMAKKSTLWTENYEYYLGPREPRSQEETGSQLSDIFIPKIGEKVDWMTAKIKQAVFNYRPIVNLVARSSKFKVNAAIYEEVCDYQLFHIPQIRRKINDLCKDAMIYNTGVIKVYWDFDLMQPVFDTIARKDFYPDPYGRYISECSWAIQRYFKSKEELWAERKQGKTGVYEESVLKKLFEFNARVTEETGARIDQLASEDKSIEPSKEGRYEIIEYWTPGGLITLALWTKEVKQKSSETKSINGMSRLRREKDVFKHGKLPFLCWVFNPKPHMFDGFGIVEQLKDLQDEYNTKRRQELDHATFSIKPRWVARKNMFSNAQQTRFQQAVPGEVLRCNNNIEPSTGIVPLRVSPMQRDIINEIGMLGQDMEMRSGIFQHAQGQQMERQTTATTTISILQRADLLFSSIFEDFGEDILKPAVSMFVELNQEFNTEKVYTNKIAEDGSTTEIDIRKFKADIDYMVNVSAIRGSNEIERAQLMEALAPFLKNPELAGLLGFDLKKAYKQYLSTFDQVKNPEDLFVKQEEGMGAGMMGQMQPPNMFGGSPMGGGFPQRGMFQGMRNVPASGEQIPNKMRGVM